MANSFRRYLEGLFDPRDPSREYGAILPISSDPNVPGSGRFDLRGGFTGDILGMLGAGGRAMRGEAYDPMDITTGMVGMTLPNAMRRGARPPPSISVYHGSPHDFAAERLVRMPDGSTQYVVGAPDRLPDLPAGATLERDYPHGRFRMSQMGTGEGNQAFGPGLYTAEAERVAKTYKSSLSPAQTRELTQMRGWLDELYDKHTNLTEDLNRAKQMVDEGKLYPVAVERIHANIDDTAKQIERQRARIDQYAGLDRGKMYEARIRANPERFLNWDAIGTPAFKEPPALTKFIDAEMDKMKNVYDLSDPATRKLATENALRNPETVAALREAGVPGIRYFDATSRSRGEGTRNYVVFDENLIEMIRKYGLAGLTMGGVAANAAAGNATPSD
jgi:hypothetical protein